MRKVGVAIIAARFAVLAVVGFLGRGPRSFVVLEGVTLHGCHVVLLLSVRKVLGVGLSVLLEAAPLVAALPVEPVQLLAARVEFLHLLPASGAVRSYTGCESAVTTSCDCSAVGSVGALSISGSFDELLKSRQLGRVVVAEHVGEAAGARPTRAPAGNLCDFDVFFSSTGPSSW
jgi:hypothetical protein